MPTPIPEKPSDYLKKIVTKENLSKLNKTVKEGIGTAVDAAKQMFKWFSEIFAKFGNSVKEKGLKATLFGGPLMGLLNELSPEKEPSSAKAAEDEKLGTKKPEKAKKIAEAKKKSKEEQEKIKKQVEQDQKTKEIESLSSRDRIKWAIGELIGTEVEGKHCWDWVEKVYINAGVKRDKPVFNVANAYPEDQKYCGKWHLIFNENERKEKIKEIKEKEKRGETVTKAERELAKKVELEFGDHLFINNKNKGPYGNHSVIFMGWSNKNELKAKIAASPGKDKDGNPRPGRIEYTNFNRYPITYVAKPLP